MQVVLLFVFYTVFENWLNSVHMKDDQTDNGLEKCSDVINLWIRFYFC